jgi:phosphate transport system protein
VEPEALGHHTSSRYDAELERLRNNVLSMGGLVERQLQRALSGFMDGDFSQLLTVVREEQIINELERSVDEQCGRILATRSPAASDLRLLIAIMKSNSDLERIGDEAQKIAAIAARRSGRDLPADRLGELGQMGHLVQSMVHDALDAAARLDAHLAIEVVRRDRQVDQEYDRLQAWSVQEMTEDPRNIRRTLDVMWMVRALERVGDHAKNIGEYVVYTVYGKDVRHVPLDEAALEPLARQGDASITVSETPPLG